MRFFPKKTILTVGLLAVVTTVGVYNAAAGGSAMLQRPALHPTDQVVEKAQIRRNKLIRIVGPQFFPDNGDIKLLGAAKERASRG